MCVNVRQNKSYIVNLKSQTSVFMDKYYCTYPVASPVTQQNYAEQAFEQNERPTTGENGIHG